MKFPCFFYKNGGFYGDTFAHGLFMVHHPILGLKMCAPYYITNSLYLSKDDTYRPPVGEP